MGLCADWFKPIYENIRIGVMGGGYIQVDETPIEYLEPGHGKTKQGYLWTCPRPRGPRNSASGGARRDGGMTL